MDADARAAPVPRWHVRPARAADGSALDPLCRELAALHARIRPEFFRPPRGDLPAADVGRWKRWVADPHHGLLVAAADDEAVLGFVHLRLFDTPDAPLKVPTRRAYLDDLAVLPAHRRRGIASALLAEGAAWARTHGVTELLLTVWDGNDDAAAFYAARGFRVVNRVLGRAV